MSRAENNQLVEHALRGAKFGRAWLRAVCPFCAIDGHTDRKHSLGVSASTGRYECFRCGTRGKLRSPPDPAAAPPDLARPETVYMAAPEEYVPLGKPPGLTAIALEPARAYLHSRRLTKPRVWARYQIGAATEGYWAGRIIVPMLTTDEDDPQWLGWVARLWRNPGPHAEGRHAMKYLYPKGMPRGLNLWNHRAMLIDTPQPVLIVEGVLDALPFGDHAAATLGKLSQWQLEALLESRRPISIVFDGDAWREGWALAARLRFEGRRAGYVRLPPKTDPDEVDAEYLLTEAVRSLDRPL